MAYHPIHQANKTGPFGNLTKDEFYRLHRVKHEETFMTNNKNMRIFTQSWQSTSQETQLIGLVAMIHGYSSESSWIFQLTAVAIAKLGFHVFALDLHGHSYSDGHRGHIPDINPIIQDCIQYFDGAQSAHSHLPAFLYGESLGGAIASLIAINQKHTWKGLILNGPMFGVSAKFKPIWPLEKFLPAAAMVAPRWRVVLTKSLVEKSYKEKWKRELVRRSPKAQKSEHPPAKTALEMLKVCERIVKRCKELEVALLVVHGREG
ncbi:2-acylglycerol O-acyltransferase protein [Dioscorea alata]|uniref:2-acylglycerol O-acyltransferase protein n=1 Tax=Dioscorea alata TaxID=55571 RepID=A0ACB7UL27_DIOAL|nr:2-acylglycerol O-acyltransferase protein [Dioscorea alata]